MFGEWKSAAVKSSKTIDLRCCRIPEEPGDEIAECGKCHVWYHHHCMDIPSEVFVKMLKFYGNARLVVTVIASSVLCNGYQGVTANMSVCT